MLSLRDTDTSKIFVTSDLHLGHNPKWPVPLWEGRGYKSVQEHDDAIIRIINETVGLQDILIFLGDFCLNTKIDLFEDFIARIQCKRIYFFWGNHNNPHEKQVYIPLVKAFVGHHLYTEDLEVYPLHYRNLIYCGYQKDMILNGQYVVVNHFPLHIWNEVKHGAWMLCGHSHYNFPTTQAESTVGKILDVGWDGHGKPWSLPEIAAVMVTKQIVKVDHH